MGEDWTERNVPETIQDRVLRLVAGVRRIPVESVTPESTFEELGMDSLDKLNLLFEVENEFDVEIDDQEAKQISRVSEMIAGVTQLVEAKEKSSSPS
jgi:acyl carrier protein